MRLSTWLMSGTVIATAAVSPSAVSATMNQWWSKTSCISAAYWSRSALPYGTKPQFSLHAAL